MDKIKFEQLIEDNSTLKFYTIGGCLFRDLNSEIAILFTFMHNRESGRFSLKPDKRIFLYCYPLQNLLKEIPTKLIESNTLILVNADIFEYAMTFLISIDNDHRVVEVKMMDKPEIAEDFITLEETEGIKIQY